MQIFAALRSPEGARIVLYSALIPVVVLLLLVGI